MGGMTRHGGDLIFLANRKFKSSRKPGNPAGAWVLAKSDPQLARAMEAYIEELENLPAEELENLITVEWKKSAEESRIEADLKEQHVP
jgi:hypothetical protein